MAYNPRKPVLTGLAAVAAAAPSGPRKAVIPKRRRVLRHPGFRKNAPQSSTSNNPPLPQKPRDDRPRLSTKSRTNDTTVLVPSIPTQEKQQADQAPVIVVEAIQTQAPTASPDKQAAQQ